MIAKTIALYKNAYSGLSPSTWWLSFIMLVNRSGTMVVPFMTIYLTSPSMGYSISKAGIVMGLFGLGAIIGGFTSGKITDRIGFYPIQIFTLTGGGILFIILGQMKSFSMICLFSFLLSLINEAFRPANATAVAFYSKEENRTRSYSLNRLAINLGWAVGGALGGIIASINFKWLFLVDGCTNICAAMLMWYFLRPSRKPHVPVVKTEKPDAGLSAYHDRKYLWFLLLTVLFATCFFQLFSTLPAYLKNELNFSSSFIGMLMALNGLVIAFIEMILVFTLEGRRKQTFYISAGVFLCGISYLMLDLFHMDQWLSVIMMLFLTIGEMLCMPFMNSFWISRSASHNRGQYAGLYTTAWSTAQTCGPIIGTQIAGHQGFHLLWGLVSGLCIFTGIGFAVLNKQ